jgi:hypothetical protein
MSITTLYTAKIQNLLLCFVFIAVITKIPVLQRNVFEEGRSILMAFLKSFGISTASYHQKVERLVSANFTLMVLLADTN